MTGNKLEQEIIGIFNSNITCFFSINQISKQLKKAYPHINAKVNELIKEGILNKVQAGRSYLCSLNLRNDKTVALLSLNEALKKEKLLSKNENAKYLHREVIKVKKEFKVYTIFHSSDKFHFVLDHIHDRDAIKNSLPRVKKSELVFYSKEDFFDAALTDKKLLPDATIIYSAEKYYEILDEMHDQLFARYSNLSPVKE